MVTHKPDSRGGAVRASQVPGESSHASALLTDPGRASCAMPSRQEGIAPANSTTKATAIYPFRGSFTRLRHSLSTLPDSVSLHWQDSLPVGGKPLPGGIRTHWTPMANFKCGFTQPTIPTPQASPGATKFGFLPFSSAFHGIAIQT